MNTHPLPWSFPLQLFEATGVELEYMIVDRQTLQVRPMCDELFEAFAGEPVSDVEPEGDQGQTAWSNELVLHVVELKTREPAHTLRGLAQAFQNDICRINDLLEPMHACLLPTAMHPWMNPLLETRLWPHEYNEIYQAYDRIFDCRGHGWSNLQSTHINLPFANDEEFGRLAAALRLILPLIPAIAASSPFLEGQWSGNLCHRMEVYRKNSARIPMMTGLVIPEPAFSREVFERDILGKLYQDLEPYDPQGILRHEFANARGAMARFDRGAIEIRVMDIQECPAADVAITSLIVAAVRELVEERWLGYEAQQKLATDDLHQILLQTIQQGEQALIGDSLFLEAFGLPSAEMAAGDVWKHLLSHVRLDSLETVGLLERMLAAGTLASRIVRRTGQNPTMNDLFTTYRELADCLAQGQLFGIDS